MCWPTFTSSKLCVPAKKKKTQLSRFARAFCAAHIPIRCQHRTSQILLKNRHNSVKLCWNKSKKIPRLLNNDERNQAIGILNASMSATVVSRHFCCTRKTIIMYYCVSNVYGDDSVSQETLPTVLKVVGHVWPLLPMIAIYRLTAST